MYIIPIGWLYVALMMSVAEATSTQGSVLGAIITFLLYGVLPVALVLYYMGAPARKRAIREREAAERAAAQFVAGPPQDELAPLGLMAAAPGLPAQGGTARRGVDSDNAAACKASDPHGGGAWGPIQPDAGGHAATDAVAPVREEP